MKRLEDKGFIDQAQWQRVLLEQTPSANHSPTSEDENPQEKTTSKKNSQKKASGGGAWAFSILLHLALVLFAGVWVWQQPPKQLRDPVIPTVRLSATPGGAVFDQQTQLAESLPKLDMQTLMEPTFEQLPGLSSDVSQATASLLIPSPLPLTAPRALTPTPAAKSLVGSNPFAGLMPNALEPTAAFFGVAGNAQNIVYVVDASGSLIDTLPYVLAELRRSILRLSQEQRFTVLFFQGNSVLQIPPAGLRQATIVNQQRAVQWVDPDAGHLFAKGKSNPLPALKQALSYEPDLLFLLTDNLAAQQSGMADDQTLLREIATANTVQTAIHTIQFLYHDPPPESPDPGIADPGDAPSSNSNSGGGGISLLKRLAQQHGGKYTFIDAKDLK